MKILIREANWLGDAVLTIPSLIALHNRYPEARMMVAAKKELLPLFNLLSWEVESIPLGGIKAWRRLKEENFDMAIIFPNSFRAALEVFLSGAKRKIGYATGGRSMFLTERIPVNKKDIHQADYYYHLLEPLGIKGTKPTSELAAKEKDKELMFNWLKEKGVNLQRPLITISPGASYGEAKCWPEGNFAKLIQKLSGQGEIIFIGTKKDAAIIEKIISLSGINPIRSKTSNGARAFNLAGETSISQLAALFSISKLIISNDNGAMHLASVLGAAVIGLFGPTDPLRTGPLGKKTIVLQDKVDCSPCRKRTCLDKKCFSNITVDRVYEAIKNVL